MRQKEPKTREKILKNALRLFAAKGFFRTTVEDIALATGVAKGTVYLYFRDKQDLYAAAIDEHFNRALNMLSEVAAASCTPGEKMNRIAGELVNHVTRLKTTYMPFTYESVNLTGMTLKKIHSVIVPKLLQMTEIVSRIISDGIEQNEFRKVNPRLAAFHFLGMIRTMFFNHYHLTHEPIEAEGMLELFFEGLNKRR
ncbi:TetR/AcrR family transcriptional regulator [candidate division WOR-3 bacterium]|nr:TetR/AcrR family transcriptional regulator [candidate division WOR-3 bacterium]